MAVFQFMFFLFNRYFIVLTIPLSRFLFYLLHFFLLFFLCLFEIYFNFLMYISFFVAASTANLLPLLDHWPTVSPCFIINTVDVPFPLPFRILPHFFNFLYIYLFLRVPLTTFLIGKFRV
jgi:hypothetical protein